MKHTVKLDLMKALVIEAVGEKVSLTITVGAVPAYTQLLTRDQADVIASAIESEANQAFRNGSAPLPR